MEALNQLVEGKIDFEGQRQAELVYRVVAVVATALSFIAGYLTQSMFVCMSTFGATGVLLVAVLAVPWPSFNKHPVAWLPDVQSGESAKKGQ
ncbi:microsomal signal peptidase 12 kDa subunit-domain-containing protein [Auriculariales sp. MPI-PUGE-AT-0066]|nr:microsomal signal peptidase 12 kDa subunit-domain-containing protein [Auriculariales sp. MPI-PUGE-AT-0066]